MKVLDHRYGVKEQDQIYSKSVLRMVTESLLSFFMVGVIFSSMHLVCGLQQRFQIINLTLESKVKVNYT